MMPIFQSAKILSSNQPNAIQSNTVQPSTTQQQSPAQNTKDFLSNIQSLSKKNPTSQNDIRQKVVIGFEWDLRVHYNNVPGTLSQHRAGIFMPEKRLLTDKNFKEPIKKTDLNHPQSTFKATIDDVVEMHVKEGTLDSLRQKTSDYSDYLQTIFNTDNVGGAFNSNHGLHIHVDIHHSFKDAKALGRFFTLLYNVTPALKSASRINVDSKYCSLMNEEHTQEAAEYLEGVQHQGSALNKIMPALYKLEKHYDMPYPAVSLKHAGFGRKGTVELRFFQSPSRPEEIHTITTFVDKLVAFAHEHPEHRANLQLKPEEHSNVYEILNLVCGDDLSLIHKMMPLLESKNISPVATVANKPDPDDWRWKLAFAIKRDDVDQVCEVLSHQNCNFLDMEVDGINALLYAQQYQKNNILDVFNLPDFPKSESFRDQEQFYKNLTSAKSKGFSDLENIRLFKKNDLTISNVLKAPEHFDRTILSRIAEYDDDQHLALEGLKKFGYSDFVAGSIVDDFSGCTEKLLKILNDETLSHEIKSYLMSSPNHNIEDMKSLLDLNISDMNAKVIISNDYHRIPYILDLIHSGFSGDEVITILKYLHPNHQQIPLNAKASGVSNNDVMDFIYSKLNHRQVEAILHLMNSKLYSIQLATAVVVDQFDATKLEQVKLCLNIGLSEKNAIETVKKPQFSISRIQQFLDAGLKPSNMPQLVSMPETQANFAMELARKKVPVKVISDFCRGLIDESKIDLVIDLTKSGFSHGFSRRFAKDYASKIAPIAKAALQQGHSEELIEDELDSCIENLAALAKTSKVSSINL